MILLIEKKCGGLRADVVNTREGLETLKESWGTLLRGSRADGVFMTWEYAVSWWEEFGDDYELRVVVFRDRAGEICGIAPLMLGPGNTAARRYVRHLAFIGQLNDSLTEYQEIIVRPGMEEGVAELMAEVVVGVWKGEWEVLYFPVMPAGSKVMECFAEELEAKGHCVAKIFPQKAPKVELGDTWEQFLSARSKNFRKKVKRALRRFDREFDSELVVAGEDIPIDEAMEALERLNSLRWGDRARSFQSNSFGDFHRRLAEVFDPKGWLALTLLKVDGEYVAAQYDFIYGGKVWGFQGGWKPEFAEYSIGKVMIAKVLQRYIEQGLDEYDFLAGEADYKESWSDGERRVYDLEVANRNTVRGFAFGVMREVRRLVFNESAEV